MTRFRVAVVGFLAAGWATAGWAQSNITLFADADTTVHEDSANGGSPDTNFGSDGLEIRSRNVSGSGRQRSAYIRFDLRQLASAPQSNAVFTLTRDGTGGGSVGSTQQELYGLRNDFGNTPQGWLEDGLTYNSTGLEVPGDGDPETRDLDASTNRLIFISNPQFADEDGVKYSVTNNAALDAFLAERYADGGFATFYLVERNGADRDAFLHSSETGGTSNGPMLEVVSDLQAVPDDTTAPTVAGVTPEDGATNVSLFVTVNAWFSEDMDEASITNNAVLVLMDEASNTVSGTQSYNAGGLTVTFTPDVPLTGLTTYTAMVVPAGLTDAASNAMVSGYTWSFTTEQLDIVDPTVVTVFPTNGTVDVERWTVPQATFSEAMDPLTLTTGTCTLADSATNLVEIAVIYDADSLTVSLDPLVYLIGGETYTATIQGGVGGAADEVGNTLASNVTWSFSVKAFDPLGANAVASVADATSRQGANTGTATVLDIRSFSGDDFIGYFRFDLSQYAFVTEASFVLYKTGSARNDSIVTGRHQVFGLLDITGNTPQVWFDSVDIPLGDEFDGALEYDIDTNRVFILDADLGANVVEDVPGSSNPEGAVAVSGSDLVTFLNDRIAAGGQATLLARINQDNRGYGFATRENPVLQPPILVINGAVRPVMSSAARTPEGFVITWPGVSVHTYGVQRNTNDLVTADFITIASNLPGGAENSYTDAVPPEVQATYRVFDEGGMELFSDDFDGPAMGWTAGSDGTTSWDLGTPGAAEGPGDSEGNCYATNLGGNYGNNANISLLSPVINLTSVTNGVLRFDQYLDAEGDIFDFGEVYVRDEFGAAIPALAAPLATFDSFVPSTGWEPVSIVLPPEAQSTSVIFEFRFESDGGTTLPGWFIDNVQIDTP